MEAQAIHQGFMWRAYEKLKSDVVRADTLREEKGIDGTTTGASFVLCTCDENVQGCGIPWGIEQCHFCNCAWEVAQGIEYERLINQPLYVNVYLHDRAYGGPEEGGWWFDTYEIKQVIPVHGLSDAQEIVNRLEDGEYTNEGRRDVSSVLSEGEYIIQIEDTIGMNKPERSPHYE